GAEVAQVDRLATSGFARGQRCGAAQRRRTGFGDVLQDVGDRLEALVLDLGAADCQHRLRSLDIDLANARARHLDTIMGGGLLVTAFLCQRGAGTSDGSSARDQREGNRVAELGGLQRHFSLQLCLGHQPVGRRRSVNKDAKSSKVAADTTSGERKIKVSLTIRMRFVIARKVRAGEFAERYRSCSYRT